MHYLPSRFERFNSYIPLMKKLIKQQNGRGWNREIMTKIEKTVNLTLNVGDAVLELVAFTE